MMHSDHNRATCKDLYIRERIKLLENSMSSTLALIEKPVCITMVGEVQEKRTEGRKNVLET